MSTFGNKRVHGVDPEQDREDTIAFEMSYCQHYTPKTIFGWGGGKATGLCGAGVCYAEVGGDTYKNKPCIDGHKLPDPTAVCPKWDRRTREQGIERYDLAEASMNRMRLVMPVVAEWRKKPPRGKSGVIECPACKGKLHLSQASSNGHVHGRCETQGCVSWME